MSGLTWDDLEFSLGRHLLVMPDDDVFSLYVDDTETPGFDPDLGDHPRYIQFLAHAGGQVRCEVASNTYLPETLRHGIADLIAMRRDGWKLPQDEHTSGSPNIFVDVDAADPWRAAAMAMNVFRQVWCVAYAGGVVCDADALRGPNAFVPQEAPSDFRTTAPLD